MKRFILVSGLVACLSLYAWDNASANQEDQPQCWPTRLAKDDSGKVALLIGISHYSAESGWEDLSTGPDLVMMHAALARQGFRDICELRDGAATHDGIEQAVRSLLKRAKPGTVVVLHYSGHGQRITDDNHEELDGYDETLVPANAPKSPPPGYSGALHIRDDEVNGWLQKLRNIVGPRGEVLISLDSCFSGTGSRGEAHARGSLMPIGPPQIPTNGVLGRDTAGGFVEEGSGLRGNTAAKTGLGRLIVLSAAQANELDYQTIDRATGAEVGPLSLALSTILASASPRLSYRALFEQIKILMAGFRYVFNTPQAEGDLDFELFAGRAVEQPSYLLASNVDPGGTQLTLAAGSLLGLFPGSRVDIHPAGTTSPRPEAALARGRVDQVEPLRSVVILDARVDPARIRGTWAFVTARSFGDLAITARIEGAGRPWAAVISKALAERTAGLIELRTGDANVAIRELPTDSVEGPGVVVEVTHDGTRLLGPLGPESPDLGSRIADHLVQYARNLYLRGLDLRAESLNVNLEILPCRLHCRADSFAPGEQECTCGERFQTASLTTAGGRLQIMDGLGYELEIRNQGRNPAYVTVLELMPDGQVQILWPPANQVPEALPIGMTYKLPDLWEIGPPYGGNLLKLFASDQPVDFHWLFRGQTRSRGPRGPLETLFDGLVGSGARGSEPQRPLRTDTGVTTRSLLFDILPVAGVS